MGEDKKKRIFPRGVVSFKQKKGGGDQIWKMKIIHVYLFFLGSYMVLCVCIFYV